MNEQFLYYIWQYRLQGKKLIATTGEEIEILKPGYRNTDAGPDFTEAMLRTGTEVWAGNIEIHLKTSDWYKHHHEHNRQYSNLILHVVYENDLPGGEPTTCPTLELKPYIDTQLWLVYQGFLLSQNWIPCAAAFNNVFPVVVHSMLERVMMERMERKVAEIQRLLNVTRNNLHESFYIAMARSFGQKGLEDRKGTGLGLYLTWWIIQKHKGHISASSEPGHWAEFTVELPLNNSLL